MVTRFGIPGGQPIFGGPTGEGGHRASSRGAERWRFAEAHRARPVRGQQPPGRPAKPTSPGDSGGRRLVNLGKNRSARDWRGGAQRTILKRAAGLMRPGDEGAAQRLQPAPTRPRRGLHHADQGSPTRLLFFVCSVVPGRHGARDRLARRRWPGHACSKPRAATRPAERGGYLGHA